MSIYLLCVSVSIHFSLKISQQWTRKRNIPTYYPPLSHSWACSSCHTAKSAPETAMLPAKLIIRRYFRILHKSYTLVCPMLLLQYLPRILVVSSSSALKIDPPWEEYVHRAPGVTDHMESWTFEEIMNLKIEVIHLIVIMCVFRCTKNEWIYLNTLLTGPLMMDCDTGIYVI